MIIWGRKITRRKLGFIADFCAMCRTQRPFALERVGSVAHLYFVGFGQGKLVGYERTCTECATAFAAEEATYASTSKALVPLIELKRVTFPNLDVVRKAHIAPRH